MANKVIVEQIDIKGNLVFDYDHFEPRRKLSERISEIINYRIIKDGGTYLLTDGQNVLILKQITYLGVKHPHYKKRIQLSKSMPKYINKYEQQGKKVFIIGVYTYKENVILCNFRKEYYSSNKFNNSSAHVLINDLYQATKKGYYKKTDARGNVIDCFRPEYLEVITGNRTIENDEIRVISEFNSKFEFQKELHVMKCVPEMTKAGWPDRNQGEWPGFYLEYCYDRFLKSNNYLEIMRFQKVKNIQGYDFDVHFPLAGFYGDLKSSTNVNNVSPGNDKRSLDNYLKKEGKFWYIVYEHDTVLAKQNNHQATIEWNKFREENGYKKLKDDIKNGKIDWMLSYKTKLKESVTYTGMFILEVNDVNKHLVLGNFNQGKQPDGSKREGKYMIKKKDIENFIVYRY